MTRLIVAVCVCAMLIAAYIGWQIGRTTRAVPGKPLAIVPSIIPIAVSSDSFLVMMEVAANRYGWMVTHETRLLPRHGNGWMIHFEPVETANAKKEVRP